MLARLKFWNKRKDKMTGYKYIFGNYIVAISGPHAQRVPGINNFTVLRFHVNANDLWMSIAHFYLSLFHNKGCYKNPVRFMHITEKRISAIDQIPSGYRCSFHRRMERACNKGIRAALVDFLNTFFR